LSAELAKTHSFRLLFWRFCPLGCQCFWKVFQTAKISSTC